MNMIKASFMTGLIALLASTAQAVTPAYHINGPYIGKATIQSSGSCKTKQTYDNAQWGDILDASNTEVGYGIISSGGDLIALLFDYDYISGASDSATGKSNYVYFEDLGGSETAGTIASLGGCSVLRLISSAKTKGTYTNAIGKSDFTLTYPFNGISPSVNITNGTKSNDKAQVFSGKITFKGAM